MSYVGGGGGAYIQELTYKYVGYGAGTHDIIPSRRANWMCLVGSGIALIALVLLAVLLFVPGPVSTTTPLTTTPSLPYDCDAGFDNWEKGWSFEKKAWCCDAVDKGCPVPPTTSEPYDCDAGYKNWVLGWSDEKKAWCCAHKGRGCPASTTSLPYDCDAGLSNAAAGWSVPKKAWCCQHANKGCPAATKKCTLWGDPHIIAFDQADEDKSKAYSFYGDGDFYIVKSPTVHIQGRFEGTKYTEGLAATNQVVVAGTFLHGHKIEVGTRERGVLTVDGHPVCQTFPGSYKGDIFTVTCDANGELADVIPEGNEKRIVHIDLPLGIRVTVYQWNNYIDVTIEMPPQPGQDGVCGNANGNLADDTTQSIMARVGARVPRGEKLLSGTAFVEFTPQMEEMMAAECPEAKQAAGRASCAAALGLPAEDKEVKSCTFDMCFGMNVRARSHAKTYR